MAEAQLAPYACDHCRSKKLKCTRELPKCERCRPWPGPCTYPPRRRKQTITPPEAQESPPAASESSTSQNTGQASESWDMTGSNPMTFPDVSWNLPALPGLNQRVPDQRVPVGSLDAAAAYVADDSFVSDLRRHFGAVNLDPGQGDSSDDLDAWLPYWIPEESTAELLLDEFLRMCDWAWGIFRRPSLDEVRKLLRRPNEINLPGLRLIMYTMLAAAFTRRDPDSPISQALRRNRVIAANCADLYFEPSVENARALTMLACHFPDKLTPTRCWSIMSHAARMVLAMNLHRKPSEREVLHLGPHAMVERTLIFWAIFSLDQAMALTFGRPPTIRADDCEVLDFDFGTLDDYIPHLPPDRAAEVKHRVFMQQLEMHTIPPREERADHLLLRFGRIHGHMKKSLDIILSRIARPRGVPEDAGIGKTILKDLDGWLDQVKTIKHAVDELSEPDHAWGSVRLGISALLFQGYHSQVLEAYHNSPAEALNSALNALAIIEKLKANEQGVFNGVAWQQLYQPFTPFFIVFTATLNSSSQSHLDHLSALPRFLEGMSEFYEEAKQLKKVADRFVEHASRFVRSGVENTAALQVATPAPSPMDTTTASNNTPNTRLLEDFNPMKFDGMSDFLNFPQTAAGAEAMGVKRADGLADRVNPYFDWFSWAFHDEKA